MDNDISSSLQTCPVCNVSIAEDGTVNFSSGNPGTRAQLYARVCCHAQKPGCINKDPQLVGAITREDNFGGSESPHVSLDSSTLAPLGQ